MRSIGIIFPRVAPYVGVNRWRVAGNLLLPAEVELLFMNAMKIGLAAVAALSLSLGAAMAQEAPGNDTMTGTTWPPPVVPGQQQQAQPGMVQSGSSDVQGQTPTTTGNHTRWTPGLPY